MQIGLIGLRRMGTGMATRLLQGVHECVVHDRDPEGIERLVAHGARGENSQPELVATLARPRAVWLMVPTAAVDDLLAQLAPLLETGEIVLDGGNTYYQDHLRRAAALQAAGLQHVDVGTSGGVAGLEHGYCLMVGGENETVQHLALMFAKLAPDTGAAAPTPGRRPDAGTADQGWLHCGSPCADHFVKMIHNGIEYGIMAAYAEGLNILRHAYVGKVGSVIDAETTPMRQPALYVLEMNLPEIAETWRRWSQISSWQLDLTATARAGDPVLPDFEGRVSDSGEDRWTIQAAIDEGVPAPVLNAARYASFSSGGRTDFANRLQSALRHEFGGHGEKPAAAAVMKA